MLTIIRWGQDGNQTMIFPPWMQHMRSKLSLINELSHGSKTRPLNPRILQVDGVDSIPDICGSHMFHDPSKHFNMLCIYFYRVYQQLTWDALPQVWWGYEKKYHLGRLNGEILVIQLGILAGKSCGELL